MKQINARYIIYVEVVQPRNKSPEEIPFQYDVKKKLHVYFNINCFNGKITAIDFNKFGRNVHIDINLIRRPLCHILSKLLEYL